MDPSGKIPIAGCAIGAGISVVVDLLSGRKPTFSDVASGRFTQVEIDASERLAVSGGRTAREIAEQLRIDELGGIDALLNVRDPIGARRFGLMPQPYARP